MESNWIFSSYFSLCFLQRVYILIWPLLGLVKIKAIGKLDWLMGGIEKNWKIEFESRGLVFVVLQKSGGYINLVQKKYNRIFYFVLDRHYTSPHTHTLSCIQYLLNVIMIWVVRIIF